MNRNIATRALLAAAVVAASPAAVSAAGLAELQVTLDPLILEGLYLDQDTSSSKFQEYRDLSDGFRLQMSLSGITEDTKRQFDFQVINGGKDDAFYGLSYDVAGSWGLELSYDNIPHNFGNNGTLLWSRTGPGTYEIPDGVQQALQKANEDRTKVGNVNFAWLDPLISPYLASAAEVDVGLQRRRTRMALDLGRAGNASWQLEYKHESRNGTRNLGTSFGFNNVTEVPEPIDYDTTDATLSGTWKWDRGMLSAGYRYSTFENSISTLFWDNPWRATDSTDGNAYSSPSWTFKQPPEVSSGSVGGATRGFFDLAADNEANMVFANGRFDVGQSGSIQAAVNWSRYEQDDPLLPFTLNTAVPFVDQPFGSADREAENLRVVVDYTTRFGDGWQAGARYSYQDYSDDSPRFAFDSYVRFHAVLEEIPRITVPFSWTRETLSANVDKDFEKFGTVSFEVKRDAYDREFRETEGTTEDILGLRWDVRFGKALIRARCEMGERDIDGAYHTDAQEHSFQDPASPNNQPGLRKFDQADRDIERWMLSGSLPIAEVWNLTLRASGSEYDYDSELGLKGDGIIRYGFDLDRDLGDGGVFFLFGERADREVEQDGRQSGSSPSTNPADSWFVDFTEVNDTWGLGWTKDTEQWHAKVVADWTKSDGEADIFSPPGGSPDAGAGFDNYEDYERTSVEGSFDYDVTAKIAFGLGVLYEDYTIDSFIRQDLQNYLPGAILIVADDGDYEAWSGRVRMTVKF